MKTHWIGLLFVMASVSAQSSNCKPSNCATTCSPACSSNEVCVVNTMSSCGVCPDPKCMPRQAVDPNASSSNSSNSNSGLIGGLVGGLLGGGLLLGVGGYLLIRSRRKRARLPLAIQSKKNAPSNPAQEQSRQIMSGVIPVTFIPPDLSRPNSTATYPSENNTNSRYNSYAAYSDASWRQSANPFSDDHSAAAASARNSVATQLTKDDRRDSMESRVSHVSQQQTATVATQMMRAKPQIVRVNTVKDGLSRSGSKRVIRSQKEDDPFDDKNQAKTDSLVVPSIRSNPQVTESMQSAPGDGEITIFWSGS
ncbi:hypothetical protein K501DRAFT_236555 [Backusella circina FSU 941]|nr:hypothetical protein K501DRAFT_236555 [Backusella circina FSU 941]